MAQTALISLNLSLKQKAPMDTDVEEEPKDSKRTRICPRAVLESLSKWRIQPDTIMFSEKSIRKQGASADVELATLRLSPSEQLIYSRDMLCVAVKKFRLGDNKDGERILASLAHEIKLTSELRSHNVMQLMGFAENLEENIAWIILPWQANGNVREFLDSGTWEIPELVSLIYDVSCGIEYLHTRNPPICHGDLKSANILVNSKNRAVITDFGSARTLEELMKESSLAETSAIKLTVHPLEQLTTQPGLCTTSPRVEFSSIGTLVTLTGTAWTLRWAAPELVNDEHPGLGSDIWAFAWICWEVMTGNVPFHDVANDIKLATQLATMNFNLPEVVDDRHLSQILALCGLMNNCWNLNIDGRPTAIDCASEIERMSRAIPSSRNGQGDDVTRSTELLHALGNLDLQNGRVDEAMKHFYKALGVTRSQQEAIGVVRGQLISGSAQSARHALPETEVAEVELQESSSYLDTSQAAPGLGGARALQSEYERVEIACVEAANLYDRIGNKPAAAKLSARLGEFYFLQNDHVKAEALYSDARAMYREIGHQLGTAHSAQALGGLRYLLKEYTKAKSLYSEAWEIYDMTEYQFGMANTALKIGELLRLQGGYAEAEEWATRARASYHQIGDQLGADRASRELRNVKDLRSQSAEAEKSYEKAQEIHERIGRHFGIANANPGPGNVQDSQRLYFEAEALYMKAQDIHSKIGNNLGTANANLGLGDLQYSGYQYAKAGNSYSKAQYFSRLINHELSMARAAQGLGKVRYLDGLYTAAHASFCEARDIYHRVRDQHGLADITRRLGKIQYTREEFTEAKALYVAASNIYHQIGDQGGVAGTIRARGDVELTQHDFASAEALYNKAREIYHEIGDQRGVANATLGVGDVQLVQDKSAEAEASYVDARGICHRIGDRRGAARAEQSLGDLQTAQKDYAKARASYFRAKAIFHDIGDQRGVADANGRLTAVSPPSPEYPPMRIRARSFGEFSNDSGTRSELQNILGTLEEAGTGSELQDILGTLEVQDSTRRNPHGFRTFDTPWPRPSLEVKLMSRAIATHRTAEPEDWHG